jgi:hypothetical protein
VIWRQLSVTFDELETSVDEDSGFTVDEELATISLLDTGLLSLDVGCSFPDDVGCEFSELVTCESEEGTVSDEVSVASELAIPSGTTGLLELSSPQAASPNAASTAAALSTLINFFWFIAFLPF